MKKIITIVSTILITNFLVSCSEKTQTVEWYIQHPNVLKKEIEKCKIKTVAELEKDKHCVIIKNAQEKAFHEQQRNAPIPTFK